MTLGHARLALWFLIAACSFDSGGAYYDTSTMTPGPTTPDSEAPPTFEPLQTPPPDVEVVPEAPSATGAEAEAFAQEQCRSTYRLCVTHMLMAMAIWPGGLVAICDLGGGEGDVAPIAAESDGEQACSPGSVTRVVRLPQ